MIAGAGAGTGSGRGWQSPTPPMQQHTSSWHLAPQFTLHPENGQTSGLSHWHVGQPPELVMFAMIVICGIVFSAARASWLAFTSGIIAGAGAGTGSGRGWQSPTPPMQQQTLSWHLAPQFTLHPENGQTSGLSH